MTKSSNAKPLVDVDKSSKLVRDTFSMPDSDYQLIAKLMSRVPALTARSTKSEIIRAGLHVLDHLDDGDLNDVLTQIEKLKTGRPAKIEKDK